MATQEFSKAALAIARGEIDLSADDIDVLLVMTNTSCGSSSHATVGSLETLGHSMNLMALAMSGKT